MIIVLCLTCALGAKNVKVNNDSQLVVGQVRGEYGVKDDQTKQYLTFVET